MLFFFFCEYYRATVEANQNTPSHELPPVTVTVASNDVDFIIKYVYVICYMYMCRFYMF